MARSTSRSVWSTGQAADVSANRAGRTPGRRSAEAARTAAHAFRPQQARRGAVAGNKRAGERAVVHQATSARRALRLQHGQLAAALPHGLERRLRSDHEGGRDVRALRARHTQDALGGIDLARRPRHRQAAQDLRAHGHELDAVQALQEPGGLGRARPPVVAARLSQQAGTDGYLQRLRLSSAEYSCERHSSTEQRGEHKAGDDAGERLATTTARRMHTAGCMVSGRSPTKRASDAEKHPLPARSRRR